MVRHLGVLAVLSSIVVGGCGGDAKKPPPKKPVVEKPDPEPPKETAEDRAAKREAAANKIVPKDSTCLPVALKEKDAPHLELAAVGADAVICANDNDADRALGTIGCWKIELGSGELAFRSREPVNSRGVTVKLDGKCAHDLCLPKDSKVPEDRKALVVSNSDGSKFAMLVGEDMHIYDGEKTHEAAWGIRQDKGITSEPLRLHWVGKRIFIEGNDGVFVYNADDGAPIGAIEPIGGKDGKPVPTKGNSVVVLDKTRIAIGENGFATITTYEADTGKRAKLVRKIGKSPCKTAETDAYWKGEDAPAKCKDFMDKNYGHLVGADAVAGAKNLLVLLRGPRLGELAVLDAKTLAEKKVIKLAWCEEGGDDAADEKAEKKDDKAEKKADKKKPAKKEAEEETDE
jgi:hypothetical protein